MKILGINSKETILQNLDHLDQKNSFEYLNILMTKDNLWKIVRDNLIKKEIILTQSGKYVFPSEAILSDHFFKKNLIQKHFPTEINFISENYFKNCKDHEIEIWETFLLTIGLKNRDCLNDKVHIYLNETNSVEIINYIISFVFEKKSKNEKKQYIEIFEKGLKVKTTKNSFKNLNSLYFPKIDDWDLSKIVNKDIFISNNYIDDLNGRSFFSQSGILDINNFFDCYEKYLTKENNYELIRLAFKKANIKDFASKHSNLNVFSSNKNYFPIKELYLSDEFSKDFKLENIINLPNIFISNKYCNNQEELSLWESFFKEFGISSQYQIIDNISNFMNEENIIEITSYMYDNWEKLKLNFNYSDLMILNKNNQLVRPSFLYLNNCLTDKILLENDKDNHKFLHEKYFSLKEKKKSFVKFLILLGVKDKPEIFYHINSIEFKPFKILFENQSEIMKSYIKSEVIKNANFLEENKKQIFDFNLKIENFYFSDFIENCIENYEYSLNFWKFIIDNFQSYKNLLIKPKITFLYKNTHHAIIISSFLEYLFNNTNILPTSFRNCLTSDKIFSISKLDKINIDIIELIPCLNLNFPEDILTILNLKKNLDFESIFLILSNLKKKKL